MNAHEHVILSIDDEAVIRDSFRHFLEDYDYTVITAENGKRGLELFYEKKPSLVLCDLRMPEVDGLTVLAEIRKNSPDTPVVIVSGTGVIADAVEALRLGAWDFILKPVTNMQVLLHTIERSLERAQLLVENRQYRENLEEMVRVRTAQLEEANRELSQTRLQIIHRLGKAAEFKDNETGRHVIRVSLYAATIAEAMELDPKMVYLIRVCTPMHDIGKIGIPDNILLKAGPLDTGEWDVMRNHTLIGEEMLKPMEQDELEIFHSHTRIGKDLLTGMDSNLLETAARIAAYHHEKWDGTGYPYGIPGQAIPIEARIVALADIYDALSSRRPYKESFTEEKCQQIIRDLSGSHLDPKVVDAFFRAIDKILEIKNAYSEDPQESV